MGLVLFLCGGSLSVIRFDDLTKFYGDVRGVEGLSFEVGEGRIFGFLGPNGAGKTTTIRTLLGFLKASSGDAYIFGRDVSSEDDLVEVKKRVGYVPGDVSFYEEETGWSVLNYFADLRGDSDLDRLLDLFDPPLDRKVKSYSHGNKQMLAIIQAFMHDPDLVVMDEPTLGLDPLMQNTLYDLLEEEKESGTTFFFSSHILSEVRKVCDRVGIIRDGFLVALEDIDTLISKSGKVVEAKVKGDPVEEDLMIEGVTKVEIDDGIRLVVTGNFDELIDRLSSYSIEDIEIRESSLEDIFMHFYRGD